MSRTFLKNRSILHKLVARHIEIVSTGMDVLYTFRHPLASYLDVDLAIRRHLQSVVSLLPVWGALALLTATVVYYIYW